MVTEVGGDAGYNDCSSNQKSHWTRDPAAMFWVSVAGVAAVVAYTTVAAWQSCLVSRQVGIMAQQVKEAREGVQRQLRAYVLYSGGQINSAGNGKYQVNIDIKNGGATPAYNVTQSCAKINVGSALKQPNPDSFPFEETHLETIDIGANSPANVSECRNITISESELTPPNAIYILGVAKYRDLFQRCQVEVYVAKQGRKIAGGGWELETIWQSASDPDIGCSGPENYKKSSWPSHK
jgi:hypothetical protein